MANKSSSLEAERAGPSAGAKVRITIRLDAEIIDWFRSRVKAKGGGSYQAMINNSLRDVMNQGGESLEAILRRVIREELRNTGGEAESVVIPRGRL
jgi:hypothetical protein